MDGAEATVVVVEEEKGSAADEHIIKVPTDRAED
jgi:hypothetical protein